MTKKLLHSTAAVLLLSTAFASAQLPPPDLAPPQSNDRNPRNRAVPGAGLPALEEQRDVIEKQLSLLDEQHAGFGGMGGGSSPEGWPMAPGFPRGGGSRALLLADQPPTDEAHKSAQEDAAVMLRLLEKATRDDRRDDPMRAMGIHIEALGGRQGPQAIYLGGFGALFLLNVDYPLLAPPTGGSEPKPKAEGESEWERTRREMYGRPGRPQSPRGPESQPFDPNRVERLKTALIDALANATNLRQVASGEAVVVSVTGAGNHAGGTIRVYSKDGGGGTIAFDRRKEIMFNRRVELTGQYTTEHPAVKKLDAEIADLEREGNNASRQRQTQLTLKALKSDIDAFAKKEITRDTFAQRVKVVTY